MLLFLCNFTPVPRHGELVGVPIGGVWREVLNSDAAEYGGSGVGNGGAATATRANRITDGRTVSAWSRRRWRWWSCDQRGAGRHDAPAAADPLWYRDAVIYQLHVKTFCDSDGDGVGDFKGLTSKLDYLQRLGVDCLWLLPTFPSPFRDDGYDIADYYGIHPAYGTLDDFRAFVAAAHDRGLQGHHRTGHQPHLRQAPVVPGGAQLDRQPATRLVRLERHATTAIVTSGSSSSTPSRPIGPGIRCRRPTTGTASSVTSPTSTTTIPPCRRKCGTS